MNVIVCIDDHMGMMFNKRRQSKDEKVTEKIRDIVGNSKLYVNDFSHALFNGFCISVQEPLKCAGREDYCFIENVDISGYEDAIERLYVFKWNRAYPHDFTLHMNYQKDFHLIHTEDFKGKSHEKITLEVWDK